MLFHFWFYWLRRKIIDYTALNQLTIKDRFPNSIVHELINELFFQNLIYDQAAIKLGYMKLTFQKQLYNTRMSSQVFSNAFGLTDAPKTLQSTMNQLFKPILRKKKLLSL